MEQDRDAFSLSFEIIEQRSPVAADLLRVCAFLAADAIPEEIIIQGAIHLGSRLSAVGEDPLLLDEATTVLEGYSLIHRDGKDKTLSIHPFAQAALRDTMDEQPRMLWAERAVQAVNEVFPAVSFMTWQQCERYMPHALTCAELIEQENLTLLQGADLLLRVGQYQRDHGLYAEAELLYRRALEICEQQLGSEHPYIATCLNTLALHYQMQGKYEQAEPLYRRALEIYEQQLGSEHLDTATSLNNLAGLYDALGKYEQAELLYRRALTIRREAVGKRASRHCYESQRLGRPL